MGEEHIKSLNNDYLEAASFSKKAVISLKLFYYSFQRYLTDFLLRNFLRKKMKDDYVFGQTDKFLLNDGGIFKKYAYEICREFSPLRNSSVLVAGVGYGRNLFQLAAFKPKTIVAFDIYNYNA